ncbi:MAG: hypothetical protein DLM69_04530 [Candidatus Chloroheliales bacterium]|nr:MAG: hypothetical protein DLM69_04530 [Chloroflexota bacterium]
MNRIMVVEDEPVVVDLIESYLVTQGYQTSHARSGEEALAAMAHEQPELVLLDLRLPKMSGYEVCREMQRDARLMDIPIIALTVSTSASERKLAWQVGADDYITKPFDLDELVQHIHAQLHYCEYQPVSELTGLPTGPAVVEAIEQSVNHPEQGLAIIYINIEHLDVYNETFSFIEGNDLIQKAAVILREVMAMSGGEGDFLGDVGGGEFVIITQPERAQAIVSEARTRFSPNLLKECYPAIACEQGCVMPSSGDSRPDRCPMAELSFDLVDSGPTA